MKRLNVYGLFPLMALALVVTALSTQIFNAPPLGKLLDPFIGAVQHQSERDLETGTTRFIADLGLGDSVKIFFDERKVPHIYAGNEHDLYFAQGYVTAYFRLWQMDFLSYVSAGRLSEIIPKASSLDYDRHQRRIGILEAAERSLKLIESDPETDAIVSAYTDGVNRYIASLDYASMPFEYKLLDYEPEPWSKLKSVLVMKHMGNMLAGYDEDAFKTKMILALGENDFNKLFPDFVGHSIPVKNQNAPQFNSVENIKKPDYLNYSFVAASETLSESPYNPQLGSNSWAVSGDKTTSGKPILCSDPHLNLSFPCVWLEMQLVSPAVNVYGVSIPGTPAIIIGFNRDIAWGLTNGADDVKDWYKLKISGHYEKYEFDGEWLALSRRIETIKRKNQAPFYDTVFSTVQGPVVSDESFSQELPELKNYALRWELHNPSNEFLTFIKMNKAHDYDGFKDAIKHYACPTQNFTFACRDNTIAIHHQGKMPIKWPGQGKFILDGSKPSHLYTAYISQDSLPQLVNPASGFVLSANQHPTYANYPYYYTGYYTEIRANRIQQLLTRETAFDIEKMKAIQLDNIDAFAREIVPTLAAMMPAEGLTAEERTAVTKIKTWDASFGMDSENALLYDLWWKKIIRGTWDEFEQYAFETNWPNDYTLLDLIRQEPDNAYFDRVGTPVKETAREVITEAFKKAYEEYRSVQKEEGVTWGEFNRVNIMHMARLPALSVMDIPSAGYRKAINAVSRSWGPSWRMIVALGERSEAYGIYPGGQSGNAGSNYFDSFVQDWSKGGYYRLQYFINRQEARRHSEVLWILT